MGLTFPSQALLLLFVIVAALFDVCERRIPNWLSLGALTIALGLNLFLHQLSGVWQSLGGLVLAFAVYFALYWLRAMGAGDVKMMAALGAIVGPWNWLVIFLLSALIGGLLGVVLVLWRRRLRRTIRNLYYLICELAHFRPPHLRHEELHVSKGFGLPHAVSVALGSLAFLVLRTR
jgi:prepilin peptidase CpaA